MSKIEAKTEEGKAAATTGTEETAVSAAIARVVRMGLRPPPRFPANGDWELWVTRFELYVLQANISEGLWTKELLTLLEDEPFRVVSRQGLACSNDYKAVCAVCSNILLQSGMNWSGNSRSRTGCKRLESLFWNIRVI